jgi:hypothetical protein
MERGWKEDGIVFVMETQCALVFNAPPERKGSIDDKFND